MYMDYNQVDVEQAHISYVKDTKNIIVVLIGLQFSSSSELE